MTVTVTVTVVLVTVVAVTREKPYQAVPVPPVTANRPAAARPGGDLNRRRRGRAEAGVTCQ